MVNAILYKLKPGCQWVLLPVKALFSGKVFHHYNKWSKAGEWKSLWIELLNRHRTELHMSTVDLDGSHTTALRSGEEVGFNCVAIRSLLKSHGVVANICINKRNGIANDGIVFDELLYQERYSIEQTNA